MPDLAGCDHSPFVDHPTIRGAALITGHRRWCEKMDPDHPDHDPRMRAAYIRTTADLNGLSPADLIAAAPTADFPPLAEQARNLAGAVVRFVASGLARSTDAEQARRMAICGGCDRFAGGRCRECGCSLAFKVAMAGEHCPLDPPKW